MTDMIYQSDRLIHEVKVLAEEVRVFNETPEPRNPEDGRRITEKCNIIKCIVGFGGTTTRHCELCQKDHSFTNSP